MDQLKSITRVRYLSGTIVLFKRVNTHMIQIFAVKKLQDHAETMSVLNVTRI